MVTLPDIQAARERLRSALRPTPCPLSDAFTEKTDCAAVYFKLENLQRTGAFKERGALNKLLTLTDEEKRRGVIAASAGNHAQGVAYHARRLGVKATIVMPERTPLIKVTRTRDDYGARVVLKGANYDEAYAEALRIQREENLVFVHPFDDPYVIAGQGTIGLELLEQCPDLEMVLVPIGGGGLISGVACALKESNPRIQVIGVQAATIASMAASLKEGHRVELTAAGTTIADGIAVKRPGERTFEMVHKYVDAVVTVDEEEIAAAILTLLEQEKSVVEGAGAVGLAALLNGHVPQAQGKRVALILGGGNIDMNVISRIIERGLVKAGRLVQLEVRMPDRPGTLARLTAQIAEQRANVVDLHHDRAFSHAGLGEAMVEVTLETTGQRHIQELMSALESQGWQVARK
ncbi:threonine ammonia-lyase [Corallococcus sp. H22C18031201]|uniref:threonine ammonia-lyase n=1 Tax=Citreicoccus inhibens TaxID=2849499 RepID=UPI000E76A681|nr:threonine ammonia-lyase [Citreicoccus inhibens]MBU8896094.1 threonine ammonia-lyase [Citreicoccus inhibens]RJS25961.1 threonine ammonia-lyase [Corallococcus sp. H22C18031201]